MTHDEKYLLRQREIINKEWEELEKLRQNRPGTEEQQSQYSTWDDDNLWARRRENANRVGTVMYRGVQNSGVPFAEPVAFYGGSLMYYAVVATVNIAFWLIKMSFVLIGFGVYFALLLLQTIVETAVEYYNMTDVEKIPESNEIPIMESIDPGDPVI